MTSTKHFWWVWIGIEIAFVSMLFLAFPAKASPIWEFKSERWMVTPPFGDFTEIPKADDTDTNILEFQAPNKMKVIKAGSEFAQSIYEQMDWEKVINIMAQQLCAMENTFSPPLKCWVILEAQCH